jgi:restriction endonuclease S subunit
MVLRSAEIQKTISNNHVGLAIPHFKKENLPQLMIPLLDMEEQKALGDFYFHLCEKIENNNAICSNLEGMARAI